MAVVHSDTHTHNEQFLKLTVVFMFRFCLDLGLSFVYFCNFLPVLFAFNVLHLVSSLLI